MLPARRIQPCIINQPSRCLSFDTTLPSNVCEMLGEVRNASSSTSPSRMRSDLFCPISWLAESLPHLDFTFLRSHAGSFFICIPFFDPLQPEHAEPSSLDAFLDLLLVLFVVSKFTLILRRVFCDFSSRGGPPGRSRPSAGRSETEICPSAQEKAS